MITELLLLCIAVELALIGVGLDYCISRISRTCKRLEANLYHYRGGGAMPEAKV